MAHLKKFKRHSIGHIVDHITRCQGDGVERSNENIDPARTHLNWDALDCSESLSPAEAIHIHNESGGRKIRGDAVIAADWCVTLPKNVRKGDEERFFKVVACLVAKRYGRENILAATVHMDETTPHIHVLFMPRLEGRFNAKKVLNRKDLQTFHQDLSMEVQAALGYPVSILLDEQQTAEKAKSRLTQSELDAVNKQIEAAVAAQTASKRSELAKRVRKLQEQQKAADKLSGALKAKESSIQAREKDVARREIAVQAREDEIEKRQNHLSKVAEQLTSWESEIKLRERLVGDRELAIEQEVQDRVNAAVRYHGRSKQADVVAEKRSRSADGLMSNIEGLSV